MEEELVKCPDCDVRFYVVWCNDGFSCPEYCPFCGTEMNYDGVYTREIK